MKIIIKNIWILLSLILVSCNSNQPKILIIGDSISAGYTPHVKKNLRKIATVEHIEVNAQHTDFGLENINTWLEKNDWDIIQFNWGLWDLCYRIPDSTGLGKKDKINGSQQISIENYKSNLDSLVQILKRSNAKLVFVTTTYVPEKEPGMFTYDVIHYNQVAKEIMNKYQISVNDIYNFSQEIHTSNGKSVNDAHYTRKGYKKLGKPISNHLITIINAQN